MKTKNFANFFLPVLLVLLVGCSSDSPSYSGPIEPLDGLVFDFGKSSIASGKIIGNLDFRHDGEVPIDMIAVITSCNCLLIEMDFGDTVSPKFRETSNLDWQHRLQPGDSFSAKIFYHPSEDVLADSPNREQRIAIALLQDGIHKPALELLVKGKIKTQ